MSDTTAPALTAAQIARLAALHNRQTRYEVEVVHPDGRKRLIGYTARKSRRGLGALVGSQATAIRKFLGQPEDAWASWEGSSVRVMGGGEVRFSGRTQRDAIMGGELPPVGAP